MIQLRETQNQVTPLEQVLQQIGRAPKRETSKGMKGLIAEGEHAARLLQATLNEEANADKKLTAIAEQTVNLAAARR